MFGGSIEDYGDDKMEYTKLKHINEYVSECISGIIKMDID